MSSETESTAWPPGGGEMARRVRGHDWASTPLGPAASWPQSLRTTVEVVLSGGFPMVAMWGPELVQVYNDGYRVIMEGRHPRGLGQPARACRPEAWEIDAPIYQRVWAGATVTFEDAPYPAARGGEPEDARFTLSYSPLRDEGGGVAGVLATVVETAARVRAGAELRAGEAWYRALSMASADVFYRMSPDWSEMRRLDGRGFLSDTSGPSDAWMGRYIHPDDQARVREAIGEAVRTRSTFALEHRVVRADGTLGWTHSRAVPVAGPDGEVAEWVGSASDVTARRSAEDALRELNESLERRVAERTAALAAEVEERRRAEESRREVLGRLVTAEEDQRRRISRELHDQMGQLVTALLLGLKALGRGAGAPPPVLADLERLAEQVAREVHEVAVALRPPALDRLGLRRTLQAHLEEWAARYGVACDFQAVNVDGERFPAEVETTLFRTVQEGLTNVARHAGAARVSLILERRPGSVGVILEDDGRGFDVEMAAAGAASAGRVGLLGMRERVELLGGTLEVESGPESGTTLFARLPDRPGRGAPPAEGEGA